MVRNGQNMVKNGSIGPKFGHIMYFMGFYKFPKFRQIRLKFIDFLAEKRIYAISGMFKNMFIYKIAYLGSYLIEVMTIPRINFMFISKILMTSYMLCASYESCKAIGFNIFENK